MHTAKTQYYTATSLDGFIATPDDELDWLLQFGDQPSSYSDFIKDVGAVAMGSATYEWLLRNHVKPGTSEAQAWPHSQPMWVFTHRARQPLEGADVRFVAGDVRAVHRTMTAAANGKNIWIVGGGGLAAQFIDHGLLDEIIVQIAPVTLGAGKPLLPKQIVRPALKLISVAQFGSAFAELRYSLK